MPPDVPLEENMGFRCDRHTVVIGSGGGALRDAFQKTVFVDGERVGKLRGWVFGDEVRSRFEDVEGHSHELSCRERWWGELTAHLDGELVYRGGSIGDLKMLWIPGFAMMLWAVTYLLEAFR